MPDGNLPFPLPEQEDLRPGWTADAPSKDSDTYSPVQCAACRQMHYVNPATGRVLGSTEDE